MSDCEEDGMVDIRLEPGWLQQLHAVAFVDKDNCLLQGPEPPSTQVQWGPGHRPEVPHSALLASTRRSSQNSTTTTNDGETSVSRPES